MLGHMLAWHYFVYIHHNLYHPQQSINLDPINFGWERETPAKLYTIE